MAWGQRLVSGAALVAVVALGSVTLGAQKAPAKAAAPKGPDVVAVAVLQPLLPKMDGWTRGTPGGSVVPISDEQGYSFADAEFTNGEQKVKVTIGDTSSVEDCLLALAAMVTVLPPGYNEKVPPATTIMRFEHNGHQAASKWNAEKLEGEFSLLVGARFVVKVEGTKVESLDVLKNFANLVDLQKLGSLKPAK